VIGGVVIFARDVEAASLEQRRHVFGRNRDATPPVYLIADAASVDFVLTTKATEADKIAHFRSSWARSAALSVEETARSFRCNAARCGLVAGRLAIFEEATNSRVLARASRLCSVACCGVMTDPR
jgi:hypothetical protein